MTTPTESNKATKVTIKCSGGAHFTEATEGIIRTLCFLHVKADESANLRGITLYPWSNGQLASNSLSIYLHKDTLGTLIYEDIQKNPIFAWNGSSLEPTIPVLMNDIDNMLLPEGCLVSREELFRGAVYFWKHQAMDPSLQWTDKYFYTPDDRAEEDIPLPKNIMRIRELPA